MGIQFTGLASGLDTNSIISDLMKVERTRVENVEKERTMVEWKKDALDEVSTKLYSFYRNELSDLKSVGTYGAKKVANSNDSVAEINDARGASRGSHSIEVVSLAKGSFLTGEVAKDALDNPVTSGTSLSSMVAFATDEVKMVSISLDGGTSSHDISLTSEDTMASFIEKIGELDLDVNINFDDNYGRLFLS